MSIGEYFMSVILASVISSLIAMLFAEEKTTLSKALSTACSLFLLCVVISPLSSFIARAKDMTENEDLGIGAYESSLSAEDALYASLGEASGKAIEEVLRIHAAERAGIDANDLEVRAEVNVSEGEIVLKRVILCLYSGAKWSDPRVLKEAVSELTDAECLIIG